MAWTNPKNLRQAGVLSLGLLALGLSTSHTLMSVGLALGLVFALAFALRVGIQRPNLVHSLLPTLFVLMAMAALPALPDTAALRELRLKIPFLLLPLAWFWLKPQRTDLRLWLWTTALGCILAFLVGSFRFFEVWPQVEPRLFSPFISNVRMGTLLVLCSLGFFYLDRGWRPYVFLAFAVLYLLFLQAMTALLLSAFLLPILFPPRVRIASALALLACILGLGFYTYNAYMPEPEPEFYPMFSAEGHPYKYDFNDPSIENGHYVFRYVCPYELRREWAKRSPLHIDSNHAQAYPIYPTLLRYLSSRGLRKDAAGLRALDDHEINAIESGVANCLELETPAIRARWHELVRDLHYYVKTGNPNHKSLPIRIELWKGATQLLWAHPWFGLGIDSLRPALKNQLQQSNSPLNEHYGSLNPHNQWLFFGLTAGIPYLAIWFFLWIAPLFWSSFRNAPYFLFYFGLMTLALCTEDGLDTQAGVAQFVWFWLFTSNSPNREGLKE